MPERRVTAQDEVLRALRADLLGGRLSAGDQVVQESLADRYGVSRVPVREALRVLESEGLVVYHPHRGHFVAELSVADLEEVYRLRALLEAEAIRVAVPKLDAAGVAAIAALAGEVDAAAREGDVVAMTAANRRFHFTLFESAGMPRLTRLLAQLWDSTDAYRAMYFGDGRNRERVGREHARMVTAIRRGDAESVAHLHDEHRDHSVGAVRAVIESHGRTDTELHDEPRPSTRTTATRRTA